MKIEDIPLTIRRILLVFAIAIVGYLACVLLYVTEANGQIVKPAYTDEQIADAIFKAEGGLNAKYYYGIRSVAYEDINDARRICLNTIRNQRKRHRDHVCDRSYLRCLADRYSPLGVENDPKNLNRHWLKNVYYFLHKKELKRINDEARSIIGARRSV